MHKRAVAVVSVIYGNDAARACANSCMFLSPSTRL